MNEGKEILLKSLDSKRKSITGTRGNDLVFNGINLVQVAESLDNSIDNLSNVSDTVIDKVITENNLDDNTKRKLLQLRDLLIGKRDYNLSIKITKDYEEAFRKFKNALIKNIEDKNPGIVGATSILNTITEIRRQVSNNEIIKDFESIEKMVEEYNENNFDTNMLKVMRFINEHNLSILDDKKEIISSFDIKYKESPKLPQVIDEILEKIDIDYTKLDPRLIEELKNKDEVEFASVYNLIRKNKVEDYGILHLLKKTEKELRVVLMLYATQDSIRGVVDSLKDEDGDVNVKLLRFALEHVISIFLDRENALYRPKYRDYEANINLLKNLGINFKTLITRNPLFLLINNDVLSYTLDYAEQQGADKKKLINKCYKSLALDPSNVIQNIDILKGFGVDMSDYFKNCKDNYTLLKVHNLQKSINDIIMNYNVNPDPFNYTEMSKVLSGLVYKKALESEGNND